MSAPTIGQDWRSVLESLKPGWDSYDALPISSAAMDTLQSFSVVPCNDGSIQIEIHRDGINIEIEIGADGTLGSVLVGRDS
jgi:hypothetical protein